MVFEWPQWLIYIYMHAHAIIIIALDVFVFGEIGWQKPWTVLQQGASPKDDSSAPSVRAEATIA